MGFWTQLRLLLWKNFTLRKRHKLRVLIEICWPLCLFLILVAVKTRKDLVEYNPECHYDGKAMPSAGLLPFLQSYVCTFNNTCHPKDTQDEIAGDVQGFNNSLLTRFVNDVESVLSNNVEREEIIRFIRDFSSLQKLINMINNGTSKGDIKLSNLLVDPHRLQETVANQSINFSEESLNLLLNGSLSFRKIIQNYNLSLAQITGLMGRLNETNVREQICQEELLERAFDFSDPNTAMLLQEQICNLTQTQALELYNDFMAEYNSTLVINELREYWFQNLGQYPNIDRKMIETLVKVAQDTRDLESLRLIFDDLQRIQNDFRDQNLNNSRNDTQAMLKSFGRLLCGRENSFLNIGSGQGSNSFFETLRQDEGSEQKSEEEKKKEKAENDHKYKDATPFCRDLYISIENSGVFGVLWRYLKPIVLGAIPYTPDTPRVREIIKLANETFFDLSRLIDMADQWRTNISPAVYKFLDKDINGLRAFISSGQCEKQLKDLQGRNINGIMSQINGLPQLLAPLLNNQNNINIPFLSSGTQICQFLERYIYNGNDTSGYDWRDSLEAADQQFAMLERYLKCFRFNKFIPYKTESALINDSVLLTANNTLLAALVFDDIDETTTHIRYKLRMNSDNVDSTKKIEDTYWKPGARANALIDLKYLTFGFAFIQDMVDHAIIQVLGDSNTRIGVELQQFPYPCFIRDKFVMTISRTIPLFMTLAWIYTVAMLVKSIVYEKEQRLKEVMKIMGLGNGVHWLAWFINAFVMMFITIILLLIIFKAGRVLEHSDPSVIFIFMLAFTYATISLCFLISTLFSKANLSAVCGAFIYFILYMPYTLYVRWEEIMSTSQKAAASLSSGVAFGFGCSYISRYEEQGVGIQWSNIASSPMTDDTFSMQYCIGMLIIDGILYCVMTWYIEAVFPGQYGIPRKFYFPIQKSYWFGNQYNIDSENAMEDMQFGCPKEHLEAEPSDKTVGVGIRNLRKVYATGSKVAVDGLSLNFYEGQITSFLGHNGAGKTTTMSILTGLFPPTQGTAYIYGRDIRTDMDDIRNSLGMCPQHNVLFDRLTVEEHIWFYARLKGRTEAEVQAEMPQMIQDVGLVDKSKDISSNLSGGMKRKLSVAVAFVGGSKTVILDEPTAGVDPYARRAIWELLLKFRKDRTIILSTHHMDEADILGDRIAIISQGKLCCCGSSLFLKSKFGSGYYLTLVKKNNDGQADDEDDIVKMKLKQDDDLSLRPSTAGSVRTIVDVLPMVGAEVDEGFGESNGSGSGDPPTPPEAAGMIPGFSVGRLTGFINKYVNGAKLVDETSTELCYQLPSEAVVTGDFETLFTHLERNHHDLGIDSFGLSDTSLEEVFLAVAEETNVDELNDEATRNNLEKSYENGKYARPVTRLSFRRKKKFNFLRKKDEASRVDHTELVEDFDDNVSIASSTLESKIGFSNAGQPKLLGWYLIFQQFCALFIKRFHHVRRSKKGFICEIILPAGFVALAISLTLILPPLTEEPSLELHPWIYTPKKGDPELYMFYSNDKPTSNIANSLESALLNKPWVGTRCMDPSVYSIEGYPCSDYSESESLKWTARPYTTGNTSLDSPQCDCSTGFQSCPKGAGGPTPSVSRLPTTDLIYNMTGRNISDWLVKTNQLYRKKRYAGISFGEINPIADLNSTQIVDTINRLVAAGNNGKQVINSSFLTDIDDLARDLLTRNVAKVWYNNKGWAASVAYMNVLNNIILRSQLPSDKDPALYGITTINHPMSYNVDQFSAETLFTSVVDLVVAICVIFAMSFIPASFLIFLIEERVSDSKHMQFVSGINPTVYWISTFAWDLVNYLVPAVLCILIFLAFNQEAYVSSSNAPCLVALLFLYGWAIIPMMYPFSRLFSVPSSAFVALSCANVFLGTVSTLATFILELLEQSDEELAAINKTLKKVFLMLPHYCLGRGLIDMTRNQLQYDLTKRFYPDAKPGNILAWDLVGRNLFSLAMIGIVCFILNWLIEYNFFIKPKLSSDNKKENKQEDVDVTRERQRVLSGEADDDVLVIKNLSKVFRTRGGKKKMKAVDNLCVGVPKGQCFGLLGVNGAGKTTTFKMLTGDVPISGGSANICQKSVLKEKNQVRQMMGYCPQFDALDALLTGREHLEFYARVRGIEEKDIKEVAQWAISKLGLRQYADKSAGTYSGGNKRKLSTAISLIGNPQVIFLDEPTTGMDPKARRFLWNCIGDIVKDGRSVILTSHSMEECEALCGRLVIMVNGQFKCIGSSQHLKNRFGDGYTIVIRISGQSPNMEPIKQFMTDNFSMAKLQEQHNNMVQYQLATANLSLASLFSLLESAKQEYHIEDYSVTQTTLDQVFINFAKVQTELDTDEVGDASDLLRGPQGGFNPAYDEQSLTGSTVDLIRADSGRGSTSSKASSRLADVSIA